MASNGRSTKYLANTKWPANHLYMYIHS